jgi:predicted metal-dependent phosphoesterase TrpH
VRLSSIALTDHDTLGGIPEALAAGAEHGVRIITGCEFSVQVQWGEMHLLAYFLPNDNPDLARFLLGERDKRVDRAYAMVERLNRAKVATDPDAVLAEAAGGAVGRPHLARVLVRDGVVKTTDEAFHRFLGSGKPGYVPKDLPSVEDVTALVCGLGGVTSAAHLRSRASRVTLEQLRKVGVDAVEVMHPVHNRATSDRIRGLAGDIGLLVTGGSDWHGDSALGNDRAPLGSLRVPESWLSGIELLHRERVANTGAAR